MDDDMNLNEISPHLRLKISPRARRMALRLDTHARVVQLVVPKRASLDRAAIVRPVITSPRIEHHIDGLPKPVRASAMVRSCRSVARRSKINIHYKKELTKTTITLKKKVLSVYTNKRDPSARIRRFLCTYAEEKLTQMAKRKANKIGKGRSPPSRSAIPKPRWGSCSEDHKLSSAGA